MMMLAIIFDVLIASDVDIEIILFAAVNATVVWDEICSSKNCER